MSAFFQSSNPEQRQEDDLREIIALLKEIIELLKSKLD